MTEAEVEGLVVESVPPSAARLFRMSWQLELWFREMVHVELRAARPNWEDSIRKQVRAWPPRSFENDKRLHHMATTHQEALSYLTFGELWSVIAAPDNWPLFAPYLPPRENVLARIDEVKTIRNRVAHCRWPHSNDERRLELFLRDVDPLLRRFCLRYTTSYHSAPDDPVANALRKSWHRYGHVTELFSRDVGWLHAPDPHRANPRLHANLGQVRRPHDFDGSEEGAIYRLELLTVHDPPLDLEEAIEGILKWQSEIIHVAVTSPSALTVTIPAHLGTPKVLEIVADLLDVGRNSLRRPPNSIYRVLKREWPEFVLLPSHPLAAFTEEYSGTLFDLGE